MPLAGGIHDADLGLVKVQMPEPVDVGDFVGPHLTAFQALCAPLLPCTGPGRLGSALPSVVAHAAEHGLVAGQGFEVGLFIGQRHQVVIVQLDVPSAMGLVLGLERGQHGFGNRPAHAGIRADFAAQGADGVLCLFGLVVPALDGRCGETDAPVGLDGVLVVVSCQPLDGVLQLPSFRRAGQQFPDHREPEPGPALPQRDFKVAHGISPCGSLPLWLFNEPNRVEPAERFM